MGNDDVGIELLERGEDCSLSDSPGALAAMPDGLAAATTPLRAVGGGWELDARGAVSGMVLLRGRQESAASLSRVPAPIPVVPGDYGLIQYGLFALFFQYTAPAPAIAKRTPPWLLPFTLVARLFHLDDLLSGLSLFSSVVFHLGIIGLLIVNWTPPDYRLPPELVSPEDYAERFGLKRVLPEPESAGDLEGCRLRSTQGTQRPWDQGHEKSRRGSESPGQGGHGGAEREGKSQRAAGRDQARHQLRRLERGACGHWDRNQKNAQ